MRVLIASKFLHHVGGVETYIATVASQLRIEGHEVAAVGMRPPEGHQAMGEVAESCFMTPTRDYHSSRRNSRFRDGLASVYSSQSRQVFEEAVRHFRPDVVHFHGTCYQLTSSVVQAARSLRLPRLATLHEYKLACANQRLWNDRTQQPCTACVGAGLPARALAPVRRRCIKGSLPASALGAVEDFASSRVWRSDSALLMHVPSHFLRSVLLADGWPAERLEYLDLPWPQMSDFQAGPRKAFFYLGRLAPEKDVATMLRGWASVEARISNAALHIGGDGIEGNSIAKAVQDLGVTRVRLLGRLNRDQIQREFHGVLATVHPAAWFENSPIAVRESLAAGVPALVADSGGMPELLMGAFSGSTVHHSQSGWAQAFLTHRPGPLPSARLQEAVRTSKPTAAAHVTSLLELYERAVTANARVR